MKSDAVIIKNQRLEQKQGFETISIISFGVFSLILGMHLYSPCESFIECHQTCLPAGREKLKIIIGAVHFDFAQYEPSPFGFFAGLRLAEVASATQAGGFPCLPVGRLAAEYGKMDSNYFRHKHAKKVVLYLCHY